jgi:hypothetical protein
MAVLDIPLDDYDRIRADGHFVVAAGHATLEIEHVVARRHNYVIVSKD